MGARVFDTDKESIILSTCTQFKTKKLKLKAKLITMQTVWWLMKNANDVEEVARMELLPALYNSFVSHSVSLLRKKAVEDLA